MLVSALLHLSYSDICVLPDTTRVECGFPGITVDECNARGCCFANPGGDHQCSKSPQPCVSRAATCSNHGACVAANATTKRPAQCACDAGYSGSRCDHRAPTPAPTYPNVSTVHVINSCHLDIGFADSSAGIVNRYFDHHFPYAAQQGAALRSAKGSFANKRLAFMFQSWVVSMYLDCPPNLGLHCPSSAAVATFEGAVAAGDITWHAFPHNAELAVMDPSLIEAGLALTWALDDRFNMSRKATLSQRDVPGLTRALIPLLKSAGVRAVSIGANDGSTPPDVPPAFLWRDRASRTDIVALLNWPGYGSWNPKATSQVIEPFDFPVPADADANANANANANADAGADANADAAGNITFDPRNFLEHHTGRSEVPYFFHTLTSAGGAETETHALVYNFNGDNAGPRSAGDYIKTIASIKGVFPNADVVASTFDEFTSTIADEVDAGRQVLPVVTAELADTWIYGVPSDPQKVARARVLNRAWAAQKDAHLSNAASVREGGAMSHSSASWLAHVASDAVLLNATRFALKFGEHTWGRDVKSNLHDNYSWRNKDFHKAKARGSANASQYDILEASWWEQRHWGITLAVTTLADASPPHAMAAPLLAAMAQLKPTVPRVSTASGWKRGVAGQRFSCGKTALSFGADGSIAQLTTVGSEWAASGGSSALLTPVYRSYSAADVAKFFATYCKSTASWVQHDYGKPGLKECCNETVVGKLWQPTLRELWYVPTKAGGGGGGGGGSSARNNEEACRFALKQDYEREASTEYGAPGAVWTTVVVEDGAASDAATTLRVVMGLFNKTQTRLPEAMFVRFNPAMGANATYEVNKLGSWVDSRDVVSGGSKHLHGVVSRGPALRATQLGAASLSSSARTMSVESLDAGVVNLGALNAYPSPVNTTADTASYGSSLVLWDNLWGTNYVMWWPFEQPPPLAYASSQPFFPAAWNAHMVSRFNLTFAAKSSTTRAVKR